MKKLTSPEREALRESFRPKRIRLLFIGEATPASGRFFCSCNSGLYRAMKEAFKAVNPRISDENFLRVFQASGCYLVDLSSKPIDQLEASARLRNRIAGEAPLSETLTRLRPERIAVMLRSIATHVTRAALRATWRGEIIQLPYPGRWSSHRAKFVGDLKPTLLELFRLL